MFLYLHRSIYEQYKYLYDINNAPSSHFSILNYSIYTNAKTFDIEKHASLFINNNTFHNKLQWIFQGKHIYSIFEQTSCLKITLPCKQKATE